MYRRNFILTGSAAAALVSHHAFAQRGSESATMLTSELTGGQIDISGTSLVMTQHHVDKADGSEHVHFAMDDAQYFDIYFWPHTVGDSREYLESYADSFMSLLPESELLVEDHFDDGGFIGFEAYKIGYFEYQRDAYPGHDLMVFFYVNAEEFEATFNEAQKVLIDGMSPFLFHEDADIVAIASGQIESAGTGTTTRTTRGSRSASTEESSSTTAASGSEVEDVIALRETFWTSYDELTAFLDVATAETSTEKEVNDSWTEMNAIAFDWQGYPTEAATITFGPDFVSLESAFIDWTDSVGVLGTTFLGLVVSAKTIEEFGEAHDSMVEFDEALGAELDSLGAATHRIGQFRSRRVDRDLVVSASRAPIAMIK